MSGYVTIGLSDPKELDAVIVFVLIARWGWQPLKLRIDEVANRCSEYLWVK